MSVTRKFQVKPLGKLLANGGGGEVVDHGPGGREKERHVKPSLDISGGLIHGRGGIHFLQLQLCWADPIDVEEARPWRSGERVFGNTHNNTPVATKTAKPRGEQ